MIEWFSLTCSVARLGFEAQNAAAFRLLRAAAGVSKAIPDEIIREEMALIPEKSPVAMAPILEESPAAMRQKGPPPLARWPIKNPRRLNAASAELNFGAVLVSPPARGTISACVPRGACCATA